VALALAMVSLLPLLLQAQFSSAAAPAAPWVPPPADSPQLLPFLRDTTRPKLAYSTWVGWYMDGGLNETSLFAQVEAMADKLRPHGWTHILHDYGWQVCGTTYAVKEGCIHVDPYGRLYPSWERYPSTIPADGNSTTGSWKTFTDRAHAKGIAYGLHLMHGIPKLAVNDKLPVRRVPAPMRPRARLSDSCCCGCCCIRS
jgi:alpha-galactosidase